MRRGGNERGGVYKAGQWGVLRTWKVEEGVLRTGETMSLFANNDICFLGGGDKGVHGMERTEAKRAWRQTLLKPTACTER
jgi:hypothetical protein